MCGQKLHRFFTEEDVAAKRPEVEMRNALHSGYSPDERWHVRKSGERFWASGALTPLTNERGGVVGFVKMMRDITPYKLADEKLQRLTQSLEEEIQARTRERVRIWRNSMELLLAISPDGVLRSVNLTCSPT